MDQRQLLSNGRSNLWFLGNKKIYFNLNELKACKTIYLGNIHQFKLKLCDYERVCACVWRSTARLRSDNIRFRGI